MGTQLNIKQASTLQVKVKVFTNPNRAAEQIKSFFDNFNKAITKINDALRSSPLFARDPDIQRIRNNLLDTSQRDIQRINKENRSIDKVRANGENDQNLGLESVNTEKSIVQEVALTQFVQNIKDGVTLPFKDTGNGLLRRLGSIGILTESDDTVKVDDAQLKRALTINPDEVLHLFDNLETGLLPRLDQKLSRVLKTNLGDIDLKQNEIKVKSGVTSQQGERFQRFVASTTLNDKVQNLIAVA